MIIRFRTLFVSILVSAGLLLIVAPASAQDQKWWADVNVGVASSAGDEEAFSFSGILYGEPSALAAAYPKPPTGASFDFGVGRMLTPKVGLGISFTGTAHEETAGLGIVVPHPYYFGESATAGAETNELLARVEGATNIQMMFNAWHTASTRVRVYGGPTHFNYKADLVEDIGFTQLASPVSRANVVTIAGYDAVETEGSGWGFHIGADATYFFSRIFGIGGFGRFTRGTVTIDEPMSEEEQELSAGGFQAGGGLHMRF